MLIDALFFGLMIVIVLEIEICWGGRDDLKCGLATIGLVGMEVLYMAKRGIWLRARNADYRRIFKLEMRYCEYGTATIPNDAMRKVIEQMAFCVLYLSYFLLYGTASLYTAMTVGVSTIDACFRAVILLCHVFLVMRNIIKLKPHCCLIFGEINKVDMFATERVKFLEAVSGK